MAAWCLTKQAEEKLMQALVADGDPQKMVDRGSEGRHAFFSKLIGEENAKNVNALYESRLLIKDQVKGAQGFVKRLGGPKEVQHDFLSKFQNLEKALSKSDLEQHLNDYIEKKLGVGVDEAQYKTISDLSNKVTEAQKLQDAKTKEFANETDRLNYGASKVALSNYINGLKEEAAKEPLISNLNPVKAVSNIAGLAKSVKASLDDSALFRQGWKTLFTNPIIWQRNALTSLSDIVRTLGNKPVMDGIMADIVSRPNYDLMQKARLAIGNVEDYFPSTLPEKVPLFGKVYKASEVAYTGFLYRTRADVFDRYVKMADNQGINLKDRTQLESIGKLVNSLTGRGDLGSGERFASGFNNIFFSARAVKANIDTLILHATDKNFSSFARKQAAVNLVKVAMGTAAILAVAKSINKNSVETDPRSSDFGKIKIGDTRFDVTGGMSSLITLAARIITNSSKSTTSGQVKQLNTGAFGSQKTSDVIYSFFENKLSPAASLVKDLLNRTDRNGNPITLQGEASNLLLPLPITTYQELASNPNSADTLISMIADGLGINTNTYSQTPKNWSTSPNQAQSAFLKQVGGDTFKKANNDYNTAYAKWFETISKTDRYKGLSEASKTKLQTMGKAKIQQDIFEKYNFTYTKPDKTPTQEDEAQTVKDLVPQ